MSEVSSDVYNYLKASYQYYILFEDTDMSDHEFDMLCRKLYTNWDSLSESDKELLDKDSLQAGTGYNIKRSTYNKVGL